MVKQNNISKIFPKHLFWDVDMTCLDLEKDKDLIIPRALFATTTETFQSDILKLESLYPKTQILQELKTTKERISNQVCTLVARRYHVKNFARFYR
jgi:hypothetical protein